VVGSGWEPPAIFSRPALDLVEVSVDGIGGSVWLASAGCAGITVVGYVSARRLYNRDRSR